MKPLWTASYQDSSKENVWRWTATRPASEATGWYRLASGELRKCIYVLIAWCGRTQRAWYEPKFIDTAINFSTSQMIMVEWSA